MTLRPIALMLLACLLLPVEVALADHHDDPAPPGGTPIVVPPPGPEGRREPPPGYRGGSRHIWRKFKNRYFLCNEGALPSEAKRAYDDWLKGEGSAPSCTLKLAGVCKDGLGFFPVPLGVLRHDDVVTYTKSVSMDSVSTSDELSGGWFPQNDDQMVQATKDWLKGKGDGYVPGHVRWTTRASECDMPTTTDSHYTSVRSGMQNTTWTQYHFIKANCQAWAAEHIGG